MIIISNIKLITLKISGNKIRGQIGKVSMDELKFGNKNKYLNLKSHKDFSISIIFREFFCSNVYKNQYLTV